MGGTEFQCKISLANWTTSSWCKGPVEYTIVKLVLLEAKSIFIHNTHSKHILAVITARCLKTVDPWGDKPLDLELGHYYEVKAIQMGSSLTLIELKGLGLYNSLCFDFFEDGKPMNIFEDKRFNPYLR